jgi:predicted transcriptional regulator
MKKEIVQKIINFMKINNNGIKITEIATGLKKNHSTIKKYLDILIDLELIIIEKEKNRNIFKLDLDKYSKVYKSIEGV